MSQQVSRSNPVVLPLQEDASVILGKGTTSCERLIEKIGPKQLYFDTYLKAVDSVPQYELQYEMLLSV